jgi:hypothetical protein
MKNCTVALFSNNVWVQQYGHRNLYTVGPEFSKVAIHELDDRDSIQCKRDGTSVFINRS